jgi:hypothetical protein
MSSPLEKVAPRLSTFAGTGAGEAVPEKRRRRKRPYKAQMATKVKWRLGDIMERSEDAQRRMRKMWQWMDEAREVAEVSSNPVLLALLGKFDHELGGLALDLSEIAQFGGAALAESKPEAKPKYSEL